MLKAYIRDGILYLRPARERDEDELRKWVRQFKARGASSIDVDYEPMNYTGSHDDDMERYGYDRDRQRREHHVPMRAQPQVYNPYGYGPQSYMPMPPDFSPQAHHVNPWPWILPFILERDNGDYRDRDYSPRSRRDNPGRRMDFDDNPDRDDDPVPPRDPSRPRSV